MSRASNTATIDLEELEEVLAREYLRVSKDRSGRLRSPEEQHDDTLRELERRPRWQLGEPYQDEGSASRYRTKRRADFDRLIADLEAGTFAAHVLILWEASRGTREVWEMARLLRLCELAGVSVFVTINRRLYDPRITSDWAELMRAALEAEVEVRKTSERTSRSSAADARDGRFKGGRRPYGFEPDGVTHREEEAAVIREMVELLLAGKTTRWLAAELNRRGELTAMGNAWHPGPLAQLLRSARIAGRRVHKGEVIGKAAWLPIIDEVTHRRVLACLSSRSPVGRRGRTPWLLTGLLRCGRCGATLSGNTDAGSAHSAGTRRYQCRKGPGFNGCAGLGIKAAELEELLGDMATERLGDVEARRAAEAGPDDGAELAELDRIAADRVQLADDKAARIISREQALADAAGLDRLQSAVEARLAAKVREAAPLDLVIGAGSLGRSWEELDGEEQRDRLTALINHVTVAPASLRGSTKFEAGRVRDGERIDWKV